MPEITRQQTNTVHGLLRQGYELELSDPLAWSMLGNILDEAKTIQEAVCQTIRNAANEGTPLPMEVPATIDRALDQDDFAAAPEGPALHPTFALLTRQFMAPQQVRR